MKKLTPILIVLLFLSCGTSRKPFYNNAAQNWETTLNKQEKKPIHTLYLLGDTGATDGTAKNEVLDALQLMIEQEDKNSSITFLGDQIYPAGMPKKKKEERQQAERILNQQLDILKDYKGKAYFIPGERDWNNSNRKGRSALLRQENYIENYYPNSKKIKMVPGKGCADPKVIKISKEVVFVFLDTQWWLQDWSEEKKINQGCDIKSRHDLLKHIEEVLTDNKNKEVVVMMHHPIQSNGIHGGYFSFKDHLLPLQESDNLAIPIPLFGSLFPIYRNITGTRQDIANKHYQELMQGIETIAVNLAMNVLFASAHDNGLQHFRRGKIQYIGSGSAARTNHIAKGGNARFAHQARGFCKVSFYEQFESWLEVFTVSAPGEEAKLVYKTRLRAPRPGTVDDPVKYPPISKVDTTLAANANFKAGPIKRGLMGVQYREMWATPVKVPIIDLEKQFGGLTPIKKGGGMASNSLRMQLDNGKQYILRSINKDYRKVVPPGFANLKVINIMKDQNSASHPYGAVMIPSLSKAAGIYYTQPKLVYLKHQRGLGNYNRQFPEELYLLEERPSGDWSDASQFGNSSEIIGFTDLLVTLREKKSHFVDQKWVCKSRMFDLLIHDWDRHDDQWRWAKFKEDDKTIYRPIPRDRDQAFYKFVGLVPRYVAGFLVKKFKTMKADVKDVKNLAFNAQHFDRYFMHELEWKEWEAIIADLQKDMTDEVIEQSMNDLPPEVRSLNDQELIYKLKSRRDKLQKIGKKLYNFLSKEVEITGSDNKDRFEITRNEDGSTQVKVFVDHKKMGELLKYERTFYPKETKEIRLYGLRGKDTFLIKGANKKRITIRIIGGEDDDEVINETNGGKIYAYDEHSGISIKGAKIKDRTSNDVEVNDYAREGFAYNTGLPILLFGSTVDDGFWFGGAYSWRTHGWRKSPFKSDQSINLVVAPGSRNAIQVGYEALFPDVIGKLDFAPFLDLNFPRYQNYFGLGNGSINELRETEFNWVRMQSVEVSPLFRITNRNNRIQFHFGPTYERHNIKKSTGRVSEDVGLGFVEKEFGPRDFLGGTLRFKAGYSDNNVFPSNGFHFGSSLSYLKNLDNTDDVLNLSADIQVYIKLVNRPRIVLANSIGFEKIIGEPQFYQYPDLGNTTQLRGFRNNRFRGESLFFHNVDLRIHLIKWNNSILPMDIGILGGVDYGRVWLSNETFNNWHVSQTVGLWFELLGLVIIQPYYSFTKEQNAFSLRAGFNF